MTWSPGVTTTGPHQIPVASVLLLYDVPRRQEPLRLAPIRLTDRVIDPTRGVGWSDLPGAYVDRLELPVVVTGRIVSGGNTSGEADDNLRAPPQMQDG